MTKTCSNLIDIRWKRWEKILTSRKMMYRTLEALALQIKTADHVNTVVESRDVFDMFSLVESEAIPFRYLQVEIFNLIVRTEKKINRKAPAWQVWKK